MVSFIEIDFKKKDGLIVTGYNHFVHGMFFAFFVFYYSWHKSNYQKKKIKVFISDLQERNFKFGDRFQSSHNADPISLPCENETDNSAV